jgi:formate dehydrogenase subunit gamma
MSKEQMIQRYDDEERSYHWVTAICFILLMLSGLALFHPAFFWLTHLFGGGTWARILHPFIGVVMALCFLMLTLRLWKHNVMTPDDHKWLDHANDVLNKREANIPPVGRYNGGQKRLFHLMVVCVATLAVTGIVMWQPVFAPYFPIGLIRLAVLLHAVAAFALILGFVVHVYAAIWAKGSVRAMTRGTVTAGWAKKHHPLWYKEMTGK